MKDDNKLREEAERCVDGWNNKILTNERTTIVDLLIDFHKSQMEEVQMCEVKNSEEVELKLDELLIERGEHPSRVRNPLYSEERELAKKLLSHFQIKPKESQMESDADSYNKGYEEGYRDASREAIMEIRENYRPNHS